MKILMIAPTPFMADRGCHTQILLEIEAIQAQGHEVLLCTYGLGRDLPTVKTKRAWNPWWYQKLSAGPSLTKILLLPILTWTTLKAIRQFHPDVVHAHLHEGGLIAMVCRFIFPKPIYCLETQGSLVGECVQHGFVKAGSLGCWFLGLIESFIVRQFPVITQAEKMVDELKRLGVRPEKITNIKDAVDTELFKPTLFDEALADRLGILRTKKRVFYLGLLETYQGVDLLLKAWQKIVHAEPEALLLLIGYPNIEHYQKMAEELGVADHCRFLGRVAYHELPVYLSLGQLAVAPKIALTEGDGKIYNYMAMGMATVAFDRPVSREILANTGIFAEFGDSDSLAEKMLWALRHPTEVEALGRRARSRAETELSKTAVGRRLEAAYLQCNGAA